MSEPEHVPVMVKETTTLLHPPQHGVVVDATVGLGGHTRALLARYPDLTVVAVDRDRDALRQARVRLADYDDRTRFIHGDFRRLGRLLSDHDLRPVDGVLFDLGVSSLQLDTPERGFSFLRDGPLDMRMNTEQTKTAYQIVHHASADEIEQILSELGEERFARRIARSIVSARTHRPLSTTRELAQVVRSSIPTSASQRTDPATRTFQALRIAVNEELDALREGLEQAFVSLCVGGVLVALSFHSLEDRIVKRFFRHKASRCVCPPDLPECLCDKQVEAEILTKKPQTASPLEVSANPRARSAKLRAARRVI